MLLFSMRTLVAPLKKDIVDLVKRRRLEYKGGGEVGDER
jgi:hypothetical protein